VPRLSSLRARLYALVLVAALPAFAVVLLAAGQAQRVLASEVGDEAVALARGVAELNRRAVDRARGLLTALQEIPGLRERDAAACTRAAAVVLGAAPGFLNLGGVSAADGDLYCSAAPRRTPVNLRDRPFVRCPVERGEFCVGEIVVSRVLGTLALGFGAPVRDADGAIVAVAFASLDVASLQRQLDELPLPEGAAAIVLDRAGRVVARRPHDGAPRLGEPGPAEILALPVGGAVRAVVPGLGPDDRLWAVEEVTVGPDLAFRVAAGVTTHAAVAAFRRIHAWSIAVVAGAALLALVLATWMGEVSLMRTLRALLAAARRIAAGDYAARTGRAGSRDELGELVRTFDEMAHSLDALTRQNRLILDAVGEGILGLDRGGRIAFANPAAARALGWAPEELLGREAHPLFHGHRPDGSALSREECSILAAMRDGRSRTSTDELFQRRDGTTFPAEVAASPLLDDGRIVGLVLAFRDVAERRRLEDQLRQAQKMEAVGQLAGGVAHDFNNLLTAIVSFARLVEDALPEGHESRADVKEILAAANRASTLTRQLLAFSRRQRLAPRAVDLADVVRGMEGMLRRVVGEGIALDVAVRAPGTVVADPGQLELAVLNLVVNARDATAGGGGRIAISVDELLLPDGPDAGAQLPAGPLAVLSVRDTGVGMDEPTRRRLFEPFFTTKPAGKGTGLGLSTVYGIVSQSGGAIRVRSEPGQGSEFRIYLPRRAELPAASAPAPAAPRPAGGSEVVLLVEDDAAIRAAAERTLASAGYRVIAAGAPDEALAASRRQAGPIDLLVSDVVLPGGNGWELARTLTAERPGLQTLFMSGYAAASSGASLLPDGVPFLAKPFPPEELLARVRAAIDERGAPGEGVPRRAVPALATADAGSADEG
jgi:PAS domain S-box-containing protein